MVGYGIKRGDYLTVPIYRIVPRTILPGSLRAPGDGSLVENIKWSEVSKRFDA